MITICSLMGVEDGSENWVCTVGQEPGGLRGVRIQLRAA
jgi:hypothetical protein